MVTFHERAGLLVLLRVMFSYVFVTFPCGVQGQVWYLIVSIPYLCLFPYFVTAVDRFSAPPNRVDSILSHDALIGSDITPCNKIDKPLVFCRFRNVTLWSPLVLRVKDGQVLTF